MRKALGFVLLFGILALFASCTGSYKLLVEGSNPAAGEATVLFKSSQSIGWYDLKKHNDKDIVMDLYKKENR